MKKSWVLILRRDISRSKGKNVLRFFLFSFFIAGCLWGVGCSKKELQVALTGSPFLNQEADGGALPVLVRVYQLKGKEKLEGSDFASIWKNDQAVLEADLLERQERTLFPETKEIVTIHPRPETAYLGVVALFLNPDRSGTSWREILPVKGSPSTIHLIVDRQALWLEKE